MEASAVKIRLRELMPVLSKKYRVDSLEVFGSFFRAEQTHVSDVDLLVTFRGSYSLWDIIDLERYLRRKLGLRVDLVPKDAIKPALKDRILGEARAV